MVNGQTPQARTRVAVLHVGGATLSSALLLGVEGMVRWLRSLPEKIGKRDHMESPS